MSAFARALQFAREAGLTVRCARLPRWTGGALLAEFDAEKRAIVLDLRALRSVRAARGEAFARRFAACAIFHEVHHARVPVTSEAAAHAFAHFHSGLEPREAEAALRAAER